MNAERLLQHYEQIADAPDTIARLRRLILDLAARGKLVPQDPTDEPASELLKRIAAERDELVRRKAIRRDAPLGPPTARDFPHAIPSSWTWTRVGDTVLFTQYGTSQKSHVSQSGVPVLTMGNIQDGRVIWGNEKRIPEASDDLPAFYLRTFDLLYNRTNSAELVGKTGIYMGQNDARTFASYLIRLRPSLLHSSPIYLNVAMNAPCFRETQIVPLIKKQTGQANVSGSALKNMLIPLPPLAEQHRIVAKADELMALCDELEAARTKRETKRDRLAAASLARLNTPDPETFRDDARFALDVLTALTARPDQIKQLRQTILNLAVRGKLVPQEPADEAAEELDKNLPSELAQPFEIPHSWRWSRLSAAGKLKGGGTPSKSNGEFWNGGDIPWVSPKDMKVDYISDAQMAITEKAVKESSVNLIDRGSLLFVVRGMILAHSFPVAITREIVTVNQDMKALIPKNKKMAEYLLRALKGLKPQMLARVQRSSHGTCRLEGSDYTDFLIPIPPLAEQHRIVAKVDELMALCDQLEASLTSADETRRKLLDALLAEALAPVDAEALQEAAE